MGWSSGTEGVSGIDPTEFVPKNRKINNKTLDADVSLAIGDVEGGKEVSGLVSKNSANIADIFKSLAEIEAGPEINLTGLDVGWNSTWKPYNNVGHCKINKRGSVVTMNIRASRPSSGGSPVLLVLPSEYRPSGTCTFLAFNQTNKSVAFCSVNPNGQVVIHEEVTPYQIHFSMSFSI